MLKPSLSRLACLALMSLLASPPVVTAQGTPFKRDVDVLVSKARQAGPRNALEASLYLAALTRCHRSYDMSDGPIVRGPIKTIFEGRGDDGLFGRGEAALQTSAWVHCALAGLDREEFAADLETIRKAYGKRAGLSGAKLDAALDPFDRIDEKMLANDRARPVFRQLITKVAAQAAEIARQNAPKSESRPWDAFMQKGMDYLLDKQSSPGVWSVPTPDGKLAPEPGITALCLAALASKPSGTRTAKETASLAAGLNWLLAGQARNESGAFSEYVPNYVTCAAVLALTKARDVKIDAQKLATAMRKARKYLLSIQNIEKLQYAPSDRDYGSIGYGGDQRGDLSNTQMAIEALRATGVDVQDESFAKALIYLRRVQNLPGKGSWRGKMKNKKGESVPVIAGGDGGSAYFPGNSPAGYDETSDGKMIPRSYGSMTYALLKCYVLAGVDKSDPRLAKALEWCFANFTLDVNPGHKKSLGEKAQYSGLFYYYLTLARALSLAGVDSIPAQTDGDPAVDWRKALRKKLASLQLADGSWVNAKNGRWWEQSPMLCTAYALLALSE